MKLSNLTFHHMGLAVKTDAAALNMLQLLNYEAGEEVHETEMNIYARLCTAPGQPTIEIVRPAGNGASPIDGIVSRYNELIYHTCYETSDLGATLDELKRADCRFMPLVERQKSRLLGGRYVSFYKIPGWGILELLERN